jgi:hypothetical protein
MRRMKGASFKAGAGTIQSVLLPVPGLELELELEPEPELAPLAPGLGAVAPLVHSPASS